MDKKEISTSAPAAPAMFGKAAEALAPLLEHLRDGCIYLDRQLRVGYLNAVARRDVRSRGADPEQYSGRSVWELLAYPVDTPERIAVERAALEDIPTHFTTRGQYAGYWVETDVIPIPDGVVVYYRDVTNRSDAEVARATSESELQMTSERLRVLIDAAPLAVIATDYEGTVLVWNPAAEAMFQFTATEVVGKRAPLSPPDDPDSVTSIRQRVLRGEFLKAMPVRRMRKDGVVLDVQVSAAPMRDRHGEIVGLIAMLTDMTAHRKLEAQLRMAQKMEAVGLLAGGVAHDFNNMLTAIKGFTSLLEMSLDVDTEEMEYLGEINKASDRAAALTTQLLAFSRRQLLRPEALDLNSRVRDLERMLHLLLRDDGELVLELDSQLNQVMADPGQIEQVILNLVVNARDAIHGRPSGRVTIRTANAELKDEFAHWGVEESAGPYVRLEVIDNGAGMDRTTQMRIFDPFFTTKEPGRGTGLGLATVYGIVKQSEGYVWAESRLGEGSIFSVYLPRAANSPLASAVGGTDKGSGSELVLLVEDEDSVRRVARRALEMHGYNVIDVNDGVAAVAKMEGYEFDMLVTDVMMPGMLGPAVAEEFRRRRPGLPVLFMSGHTDEIVRAGLLDPSTPFLAKPFTPVQLANKVREALDQSKSAID